MSRDVNAQTFLFIYFFT